MLSDTEGLAQLKTTSVGLSYAYTIPMESHNIHFGFEVDWIQKSVDWSKIIFSDQLDPVYGAIYPTSAIPLFRPGLIIQIFKPVLFGGLIPT